MKTGKPRGWRDDPAWRHARAVKAGQAAKRAHAAQAIARVKGLSATQAYQRGYITGYKRAYVAWRARYERLAAVRTRA